MAHLVEFKKDHKKHPVSKKGDVKSISDSIYKDLTGKGIVKDYIEPVEKKTTKEG